MLQTTLRAIFKTRLGRAAIVTLCFAGLVPLKGCYGTFPLTNIVYEFNGDITDEQAVHSIAMIVMIIIPVYPVAMIVDILIFNLVEFWSGDEVDIQSSVTLDDGREVALSPGAAPNEAILTLSQNGETLATNRMVRRADGITVVYSGEEISGYVKPMSEGGFVFENAAGETIDNITPTQLATMAGG